MLRNGPRLEVAPEVARLIPQHVLRDWMRGVVRAARRMSIAPDRLPTLSIRVVGDAEMGRFHLKYMNERGPTDVLSFPAETVPGTPAEDRPLGDLIIDWMAVVRQAASPTPRGWQDEAIALCVHGLAHLLGHDHRERAEARAMFRLERRASRAAGLPTARRPYGS